MKNLMLSDLLLFDRQQMQNSESERVERLGSSFRSVAPDLTVHLSNVHRH